MEDMQPTRIITTPEKYAGHWIAWNRTHTKILASGKTMKEVEKKASKKADRFWLDKVPAAEQYYGGAATLL